MKQHFLSVAMIALGGIALLTSCDTKSNNENHQMSIASRDRSLSTTLYADQATDTVWVQSTESWTGTVEMLKPVTVEQRASTSATAVVPSSATTVPPSTAPTVQENMISPSKPGTNPSAAETVFTLSPNEVSVKPGYIVVTPVVISVKVPATKELQQGFIRILPKGGPLSGLTRRVNQVGWLNVSSPIAAQQGESKSVMPNFSEVLRQKGGTTRLVFDLYDNHPNTHSLTSDAEWLKIPDGAKQPVKGHHVVELSFGENTSETTRTATLTLSSGGASTVITYVQAGRPKQ